MQTPSLQGLKERFAPSDRMPVVFLGHGSPMNVIEDNDYSRAWSELGKSLSRPKAILEGIFYDTSRWVIKEQHNLYKPTGSIRICYGSSWFKIRAFR